MKRLFRWIRNLFLLLLLLVITACGCVFYAFKVEPYRIKIEEITLNEKKEELLPIKIIQLSDLHIKENFTAQNLDKIIQRANEQNPDIVLFTGDLYDNYAKYNDDAQIIEKLKSLNAKYAKIAIWGNRDYGGGAVRQYEYIMENAGFTLLKNQNWYITLENGKNILFTGLDDTMLGNPYMPDDTKIYDSSFNILLSHEPDKVEDYKESVYDIALSGHSHGGQVNIPFLPFINDLATTTTSLSSKYNRGMYTLTYSNIPKLYVNTGIGTTHISARFDVVPEITLFRLYL